MSDCLFCRIASGEIPAQVLYEDEEVMAFRDINPQAPVHILVIPKNHYTSLLDLTERDQELLAHLLLTVKKLGSRSDLEGGFRTVINTGDDGGQWVKHLHLHVLGGRPMGWPPG
ncbi:MAG: histidine triad nucleotide-binding protein [Firmicutes bacterium]|nr:histidine triad nucleotide-binding protein [Bacillota bacterium]MCL5038268.1 histidine triad nucleotide-binding protein [Bacillota bacterium]